MRFGIKLAAIGAVAVLAVACMASVLMTQNDESGYSVANSAPLVSVENTADENAVLVTAMVDGNSVPMSGVHVAICKMNASTDGNQTTMRIMECVTLQTDSDGKVQYQFQEGEKYMICAENQNQNQHGYANMNMNETESQMCYEHEWGWQNMEGQSFGYSNSNQAFGKA